MAVLATSVAAGCIGAAFVIVAVLGQIAFFLVWHHIAPPTDLKE